MSATPDTSQEPRAITIDDLNRIQYVNDPQISPDGNWIAYVLQSANPMEKSYTRNIYLVSTDGGDPVQVTRSGKDSSPRWSPDGTQLAFVSARSDKPQIYLLPVTAPGGEPRPLTSMENGAMAPAWSPDGSQIAFLSNMNLSERDDEDSDNSDDPPKDQLDAKHRKERKQEDEKNRFDPRPMERIPYRQGTSFMDDRYPQVYVIVTDDSADDDDTQPRRLTHLDTFYSPPEWSADGTTLYTTRPYDIEADEYFRYRNIYALDVESGDETHIIDDTDNIYFGVKMSPDGKWLAAVRTPSETTDAMTRLCLIPADGSTVTDINLELDRSVYMLEWAADNTLLAAFQSEGRTELYRISPADTEFSGVALNGEQMLYGLHTGKQGDLAYISRETNRLDELFYTADPSGAAQQMTTHNSDFLEEVVVQETHEIRFDNGDGQEIQGWYILPPDFDTSKQYPLALNIHGGPHVMWSPTARSLWHEWQVHAAEGYVVFYCNPRGSDGYGEAFQQALHSNWGHIAMQDIMAGVDAMLEKGFIDETRMAITGGSYGGYMTGWIIGHTERFAAAVPQRGVYNLTSFYGTSDVPILISAEFDTEPWHDYDKLWQHSPLAYAPNITTPTLIIHAEHDYRVPIEQAEQFFAWIRRSTETPVKMLRYPREGHELSRSGEPQHRISRLSEMVDWFNTYCKPDTASDAPESDTDA